MMAVAQNMLPSACRMWRRADRDADREERQAGGQEAGAPAPHGAVRIEPSRAPLLRGLTAG
jgi:hypothetical protein